MSDSAHFSVDTRLARLLGEGYRSSELAIKELVDNAWDADAMNVRISLPAPMTLDALVVLDDGTGMTALEMRSDYLNIASDKRKRTGERTSKLNRRVKGRKGIGKFAGLTIANVMQVKSAARGRMCVLKIEKKALVDRQDDLEKVALPFIETADVGGATGTEVVLSELDNRLNFPTEDRLREVLINEYGREDSFRVFVNGKPLSLWDIPGPTVTHTADLKEAGSVSLSFTIADGKRQPRTPGIILRVDGKTVGKPLLFGLDDDNDIPRKLASKVYGEVDVSGLEDYVTADWSGVIENSKQYAEIEGFIREKVKQALLESYGKEMSLQQARLQKNINQKLQKLPEYRRQFAQNELNRLLKKFYGDTPERVDLVVDVALAAMEHDAYWLVLEQIATSSQGDVDTFASSLKQFGLFELAAIGNQTTSRLRFLDFLDGLIRNTNTLEKNTHQALEANLWVIGRSYALMSSNKTLQSIVDDYCAEKYRGSRAAKRPDLLLSQGLGESHLLIEFKRPSHDITRDDIAQAEKYRDDLSIRLSSTSKMEIMMIGRGRTRTLDVNNLAANISIHSYRGLVSAARNELEWLLKSLSG